LRSLNGGVGVVERQVDEEWGGRIVLLDELHRPPCKREPGVRPVELPRWDDRFICRKSCIRKGANSSVADMSANKHGTHRRGHQQTRAPADVVTSKHEHQWTGSVASTCRMKGRQASR
jgi:hypothetical protein